MHENTVQEIGQNTGTKDIEAAVSSSRMDENINLPQYIADSKVHYEESEKPVSPLVFVFLGGAAILVIIIADKRK